MEVSGLTRAIAPPVPELEVQGLQSHLSSEMPAATLSLQGCHVAVFIGHYLLFFVPLSGQCSGFKGSHFTHDTGGLSKRPYDAVIIEFHQTHIQNHAKKPLFRL